WQRYGWVGPGMDVSGLEDEFRLSNDIPRLLYVKKPAPDREPGLQAMIDQLHTEGSDSFRTFRTPRELARLVRDDLALLLSERFAAGGRAASDGDGDSPAPRSLPVTSTTLIGREPDIAAVTALLAQPEVRLVTLTGAGGVGKTRLSIAVGEALDDRHLHGATFVPLASVAQPELVLPRIAAAVGVSVEGERPALDALAEAIADTPTLLVLDNLEQVIGVAPELDQLLARCPRLKLVATSRTVLRLRAEREYPVSPLTVPIFPGRATTAQLAAVPVVQLFVDRARAVRYTFALNDDNAHAILEICRRLDGLPLAIELAAARVRLLEPEALLARLSESLDALGVGPVDLPERQRTLRATVAWSIGLLDTDEQEMLSTMSIFVEGWTVEAAVSVSGLGDDRTLDLLDALAGHSLVTVDVTGAGPRFRMLDVIRELAAEPLAARADGADVARRHAEFFGALVDQAEGRTEWSERLRTEEGNLGVAIRWFFAHDITPLPHILLVVCQNIWLFWQMRDRMPEGRAWIQELLLRADDLEDRAQAEVLLIAVATAVEVGDDASAPAAVERIERLAARVGDPYLESAAQLAAAWTLPITDDFAGALQAASAALAGFREDDQPFMAWSALTAGLLEMALGEDGAARAHLTAASELGGRFGNPWLEASARTQLATLAATAGAFDEVRAQLVAAVHAREDAELSTQTVTFSLIAVAQLALAEGDPRRAATALGAADGLRRHAGLRAWPSMRRREADLSARVEGALDPDAFADAFASGAALNQPDAVALIRGERAIEA
ncbi:MAG TPA: hypothetical protein VGM33_15895, partial [Baekduia sp.]